MQHHAFVIEAGEEKGIARALAWAKRELGVSAKANPDVVVLRYGLFSVEDARRVSEIAAQAPLAGETKIVIVAASRAYHEAQNSLLKLFEEPPRGTYLFLILPSLGGLLPTLRSRVHVFRPSPDTIYGIEGEPGVSDSARQFILASRERRSAFIQKLTSGKDEAARRENRDEALALVNGIEAAAYAAGVVQESELLQEVQVLRGYLHERSAPVKQILEHLALVTPKGLV